MRTPLGQFFWPDARGWIGIGVFALSVMVLIMIKQDATLRQDEFFKTIATLIIGTGLINGVVSWAYSATKGGGEQADAAANVAQTLADKAQLPPAKVEVVNQPDEPVPVATTSADEEDLPDYARAK